MKHPIKTATNPMSVTVTNRATDYSAGKLKPLLEGLRRLKFTGIGRIAIQAKGRSEPLQRVLAFREGELTFGADELPTNLELAQLLADRLNRSMIAAASSFATDKMKDPSSAREMADMLVRLRVVKWDEIEVTLREQTVQVLEQAMSAAGRIELDETTSFDLAYRADASSFIWELLFAQVGERLEIWQALAPGIPSMWAVPKLPEGGLTRITDPTARMKITKWVDGKRSLIDIARESHSDPIDIARTYLSWAETSWIEFEGGAAAKPSNKGVALPAILSVDDSPIVQTTIKRSLSEHFQVLLASNAMEALNILNREQVKLLLLDVTMPVIDGLEFCKTLRKIPKFKSLPVVMLTARDGNVNKMKGQIAGTNRYLTKPVPPEELLAVVREYVK